MSKKLIKINKRIVKKRKRITAHPLFLDFNHRRLINKAREYQHEIGHLTDDLKTINQKIQKTLAVCKYITVIIEQPKKRHQFSSEDFGEFGDMLYHIENFVFRVHAYQEKLCLFINYAIDVGYQEDDRGLFDKLTRNKTINEILLATELHKMKISTFTELLGRRKLMSHRIYYKRGQYSHYLMPNTSTSSKQAAVEWRKKIIREAELTDQCMLKIFEINKRITEKVIRYLNKIS